MPMLGHKPSGLRDYFIAVFIAVVLLVLFSSYLLVRRGYFFDAPPTADMLYVPNKALAGVGMVLLAFIFLLGPIARYFDRFDHWLGYRKEIGIVAAAFLVAHSIISYFSLPKKFPREWFSFTSLEFAAGLIGAALLVFLFIISFRAMITYIGPARWWFLQRWGLRVVMALAVLHVFVMKWSGWMRWLTETSGKTTAELANPWLPGLGILVSLFVAWVVLVRLHEMMFIFKSLGIGTKEISGDPLLRQRGRRFFWASLAVLVGCYVIVALRWSL